jgi:hypothetical protein
MTIPMAQAMPKDGWRWKPGVGAAAAEWSISEDGEKAIGTGL